MRAARRGGRPRAVRRARSGVAGGGRHRVRRVRHRCGRAPSGLLPRRTSRKRDGAPRKRGESAGPPQRWLARRCRPRGPELCRRRQCGRRLGRRHGPHGGSESYRPAALPADRVHLREPLRVRSLAPRGGSRRELLLQARGRRPDPGLARRRGPRRGLRRQAPRDRRRRRDRGRQPGDRPRRPLGPLHLGRPAHLRPGPGAGSRLRPRRGGILLVRRDRAAPASRRHRPSHRSWPT